jgi:hypothetical protein
VKVRRVWQKRRREIGQQGGGRQDACEIDFVRQRYSGRRPPPHTTHSIHTAYRPRERTTMPITRSWVCQHDARARGIWLAESNRRQPSQQTAAPPFEIFRVPLPRLTTWGLARGLDGMQEPVLMCLVKPVPPALNWLLATDSERPLPTEACVPSLKYETEAVESLCTRSYGPHGARTEALPTSLRRRRGEGREGAQVPHAAGASGSQRQSNAQQG